MCSQSSSVEKLMKKLVGFYESKEDDESRSAIALVLRAVSKANIELIKENEHLLAPTVFMAMHAPKSDGEQDLILFCFFDDLCGAAAARLPNMREVPGRN